VLAWVLLNAVLVCSLFMSCASDIGVKGSLMYLGREPELAVYKSLQLVPLCSCLETPLDMPRYPGCSCFIGIVEATNGWSVDTEISVACRVGRF
jgi:hypothetical protein